MGKNLYQWHGIAHRIPTLAWLRQLALKLKMLERYNEVKILEESSENLYASSPEFLSPNGCGTPNGISPLTPSLSPCSSSGGPSPSPIERKTSLGVACQKFLMLFLIAPEVRIQKFFTQKFDFSISQFFHRETRELIWISRPAWFTVSLYPNQWWKPAFADYTTSLISSKVCNWSKRFKSPNPQESKNPPFSTSDPTLMP